MLLGAAVVAGAGALDLLLHGGGGRRAATWGAWVVTLAASGFAVPHGPAWIPTLLGIISGQVSVLSLMALALAGGGSASPYFVMAPLIPLLSALIVPEATLDAVLVGATSLGAAVAMMRAEGRPLRDVILWAAMFGGATSFALLSSLRFRRRREKAFQLERERAAALERLASSERARIRAERLALAGVVADGVAHEASGPIAAAQSNLAFALRELTAGRTGELEEALADATASVERIREVVSTLTAFARSEPADREPCDVAGAVTEAAGLVQARYPLGGEIRVDLAAGMPLVAAYRPILVDLVFHLILANGARSGTPGPLWLEATAEEQQVRLRVSSAGRTDGGTDPSARLSLAVCREYVRRLGGTLDIARMPGRDQVTVALPAAGSGASGTNPEPRGGASEGAG